MKQLQGILTVAAVLLSCAVASRPDRNSYARVVKLDNRNVTTPVLETFSMSQHPAMPNCSRRCFSKPGCRCLRLRGDECTLYSSYCQDGTAETGDTLHGAVYYSEDPCPIQKGYLSVISPRLCIKLVHVYRSWQQSQDLCRKDGGRLIVLDTPDKCHYINNFLKNNGKMEAVWIGMRRVTDGFIWVLSEDTNTVTVQYPGLKLTRLYTGIRGVIYAGSELVDSHCTLKYHLFLCEITVDA